MALDPGALDKDGNFERDDCMAKFIEDALPSKPELGKRERREFLIALSKGIIDYLRDHDDDAFGITHGPSGNHLLVIQ
jgi:hypothetical protein